MSVLYLETSAVLRWLLGDPSAHRVPECIDAHERVVSSVLTEVETERSLHRAESEAVLTAANRARLMGLFRRAAAGWYWLEITPEVRRRAGRPFPAEPVRTLDAIHLASALELLEVFDELEVLSFDARILSNLQPLGLSAA